MSFLSQQLVSYSWSHNYSIPTESSSVKHNQYLNKNDFKLVVAISYSNLSIIMHIYSVIVATYLSWCTSLNLTSL